MPEPPLNPVLGSFTQPPTTAVTPVIPRASIQQFNDREIAPAYILALERAGREYAWAAMEAANPSLRALLDNEFMISSHHAYETWQ